MFLWVSVSRRHTCTSSVHERVQPSQQVLFQEFALILTALSIFPSFLPVPTNPEPFFFPTLPLLSIYKRCTFQHCKKRCLEQAMQLICESVEPCLRFALIPFLTWFDQETVLCVRSVSVSLFETWREVQAVSLKSSQSTWQSTQIFPSLPLVPRYPVTELTVCSSECVFAPQTPLSYLSRPGLVWWSERLHISLPQRMQPLVSRTLLWAHVHTLYPGETNHEEKAEEREVKCLDKPNLS